MFYVNIGRITNLSRIVTRSAALKKVSLENNFHKQLVILSRNYSASLKMAKFTYPKARRDEQHVDVYHSTKVQDPYRWLEDPEAEETKEFIAAQNAITEPFIKSCPKRQAILDRLTKLYDYPKRSCPVKTGDGKYYEFRNSGLQNQSVLYVQDDLKAEAKVFLDPNTLSEDGTVALSFGEFSEDGKIYAYALSASGSDWNTIHFLDTETGKKYPEVLERVKFSSIAWTHDNKGIFYSRYPDSDEKADGSETVICNHHSLYYHKVGTSQDKDPLIVEYPKEPLMMVSGKVTDCGKYLIVTTHKEIKNNLVSFSKLGEKEFDGKLPLTPIVDKFEADYDYVGNVGSKAIFRTNKDSPNFKLAMIDLENVESGWKDLIPENAQNVLDWSALVDDNKLVCCYVEDVKNVLRVHDIKTGKFLSQIPIESGTVAGFSGDKRFSEIFYKFTSFLTPGIIYRYDFQKNEESPEVIFKIDVPGFNPDLFKVEQVFYPSVDGTSIPMYIVTRKDIKLDGTNPCLMWAYGGFNISLMPDFKTSRIMFLQHFNGVIAIPNIRGGGEYGVKWHDGGRQFNKQNCFDDFQSAAEYLIQKKYTSAKKLTIEGSSNGGLLVGACINQRPDLFGAAIARVGVMDMLKFHKFTIGYCWTSDYGSSDDPKDFKNLYKFSPLHNVKEPKDGGEYPATLLLTADHDDRVVPLHSLKLIATLQHELGKLPQQKNPLLIRCDVKAGHGGGKPTSKQIEETTDVFAFMMKSLNLEYQEN